MVGGPRIGRTAFIQQAFDLSAPDSFPPTVKNYMISGKVHGVRLFELSIDNIQITQGDEHLIWPRRKDNVALPAFHGVIVLHNLMDGESLPTLPKILGEFVFEPSFPCRL